MRWEIIIPLLLYLINIISIIVIIFFRRKEISTSYAWIMVLIFLPILGFLLYYFFGSTYKLEMMSKKYKLTEVEDQYMNELEKYLSDIRVAGDPFKNPKTLKYEDMILINSKNANCFFSEDNKVELLVNGQSKFPRMFEEIKNAKHSINVMYFIFKTHDQVGKEFLDLLEQKAAEGVKVKVLYDGLGCLKTKLKDFDGIVKKGGEVQRFLPSLARTLMTANYRLHRKMVVIDGKSCYTGGINVGDDYLGKYEHITPWRDTSIRITGSAVKELQLLFFRDWIFCAKQNKKMRKNFDAVRFMQETEDNTEYFPEPEETGSMGCQVIDGVPGTKYAVLRDSYVKMCTSAKDYLYIQSPYFVPDETLLDAIRMAAQSGVDVRMMLPGIADKEFVYKVAMSYVEELLEAGVKIYLHEGFIHSKTMVIDDFVSSIGTTNLDIRSFRLDYEVNVVTYDQEFAVNCKETFLSDINDSKEVKLEEFKKRGKFQYILECLCRFFSPLS